MGTTSSTQQQRVILRHPGTAHARQNSTGLAAHRRQQEAGGRSTMDSPMEGENVNATIEGQDKAEEEEEGDVRSRAVSYPAGGAEAVVNAPAIRNQVSSVGNTANIGPSSWCVVKAKSRQHNSTRFSRRVVWFEAKPGSSFLIGSDPKCDLTLDDERCSSLNAQIEPHIVNGAPGITVTHKARMYQLVGMGSKRNLPHALIDVGSVIKVGSVSLEVTTICTTENDDFIERFAVEINKGRAKRRGKTKAQITTTPSNVTEGDSDVSGSPLEDLPTDDEDNEATSDEGWEEEEVEEGQGEEDEADAMCYICWGGLDPLNDGEDSDSTAETKANPRKANPLIRNPCGKCSGSSRYVHLNCLLTWIKSSGSGHCSICNGPLPTHFSSPPPNLELKVVRHRKGQSWVGTRRFRLSFAERTSAVIGRDSNADVRLSDRSVGTVHAKIVFNQETRQFVLQDCASLGGTYLQVKEPINLEPEVATYLKIGRTTLTLRMTNRRGTMLNMLQGLKWGSKRLAGS